MKYYRPRIWTRNHETSSLVNNERLALDLRVSVQGNHLLIFLKSIKEANKSERIFWFFIDHTDIQGCLRYWGKYLSSLYLCTSHYSSIVNRRTLLTIWWLLWRIYTSRDASTSGTSLLLPPVCHFQASYKRDQTNLGLNNSQFPGLFHTVFTAFARGQ